MSSPRPTTLPQTFREALGLLGEIEGGKIRFDSGQYNDTINSIIEKLQTSSTLVYQMGLFSNNEQLSDISTSSLKYLLIPYTLGQTYQKFHQSDLRLASLKTAKKLYSHFLCNGAILGLISEEETEKYDTIKTGKSLAELRTEKIERHKVKKKLDAQILSIESKRPGLRLGAVTEQKIGDSSDSILMEEDQEDEREYYILLIERSIKLSLDELSLLDQEIEILEMREVAQNQVNPLPYHQEDKTNPHSDATERLPSPSSSWPGIMTPHGLLRTFTIDKRVQLKKDVFKPHWIQPTITIEEAGEIEYQLAQDRAKQSAATAKEDQARREAQNCEEIEEEELKKAREWDNWKDDHRRGEGNTGSRGYIY